MKNLLLPLVLILAGCSGPVPFPEGTPEETIIHLDPAQVDRIMKGEKLLLRVTQWDEDAGCRQDIGHVFATEFVGSINIFLPAGKPPYRTPENPTPKK